jgi:hypothetical protein
MSDFVVREIAGAWAVVRDFVILAERTTAKAAIGFATQAALQEGASRVLYRVSDAEFMVAWDPSRERARRGHR